MTHLEIAKGLYNELVTIGYESHIDGNSIVVYYIDFTGAKLDTKLVVNDGNLELYSESNRCMRIVPLSEPTLMEIIIEWLGKPRQGIFKSNRELS